MENKTTNLTLEDVIKSNLANYEAKYDANDWAQMESMLVAPTTSSSFDWKPLPLLIIALIVVGGGVLLFTTLNSNKTAEKPIENTPERKEIVIPTTPTTPLPVIEETKQPPQKSISIIKNITIQKNEEAEPRKETILTTDSKTETRTQHKNDVNEHTKKEENETKSTAKRTVLDSSKHSAITENKSTEKDAEKKPKVANSIGLNIFSTLTSDSLKRYKERLEKDSVK